MTIPIIGRTVIQTNEDDYALCQEYLAMVVPLSECTGGIALKWLTPCLVQRERGE